MAMLPEHRSDQPILQPAAAQSLVEVRRYESADDYQRDAVPMATANWFPITQVESTGGLPSSAGALAVIGILVALLLNIIVGALIIMVAILVGMASRKKMMVVTYRFGGHP